MWVSTLSPGIPSIPLAPPSPRRSATSARPSSADGHPLRPSSVSQSFAPPPAPSLSLPHMPTHPLRARGAPSFSPVPPDRLKLQSVASPSVGTLIRGRLHCSGTLLAALGYQLFPYCLWPSVFPASLPSIFLSLPSPSRYHPRRVFLLPSSSHRTRARAHLSASPRLLFPPFIGRISVFMGVRSAS